VCGRLLCCLAYENEYYAEVKAKLPKRDKVIDTPHGRGRVVQVNVINETVQVELESQVTVEVSHQELATLAQPKPRTSTRKRRRRGRRRSKS
jgi:cell fate regulator YaaT (PSP1 superfamily)